MDSPTDRHHDETPDPHESFLRLWTQHEPELRAFVRSCCPRAQEVDEVMQEVSVVAWRKFSSLDNPDAFG
ncbi:MAG: sigma factor, partial [Planctomycetota bacterium]|nr:sigma factor [Planctomycetota bacterium]